MSLPGHLDGLKAVRRAVLADVHGVVREASEDATWRPDQEATAAAVALAELAAAGATLGLAGLDLLAVKGPSRATVTACRADALLLVEVEPGQRSAEVEKALSAWSAGAQAGSVAAPAAPGPSGVPASPPRAQDRPADRSLDRPPPATIPGLPAAEPPLGPWAALRRALSRGHLTETAALLRAAAEAPADAAARPEAAVPDAAAFREASQRLLEGVGSVLAGDTAGGTRALLDLAAPAQPNLSLRWLAAHWCARAALVGGSVEVARRHVKDALDLSRQLDVEARAVTQLVAAELLLRAGEQDKALAWLAESRSRFERSRDAWGEARTWLVEARLRAAVGNDEACVAAARRASEAEPGWDGPPIFLAGRALAAGDLDGAEALLAPHASAAAGRVRKLLAAVRQGAVSQADGAAFLRLHLAPPSTAAMRALERIADAAPGFLQAREAQAWMLVKLGRYASARGLFAWLDGQRLDADDRALVALGLRCVDAALQAGEGSGSPVAASGEAPPRVDAPLPPGLGNGAGDAGAVFSGRLSVFSLPDLIEFLRSARRSGLLVCSSPEGMGTLRFRQGYVTGASAPNTPSLADLLLRAGQLSAEAQRAVAALTPGGGDEEEVLRREGLVAPAAVETAARQRIELTVRQLFRWSDGEFAFNKDQEQAEVTAPAPVLVDAQELLLNLFKEQDEAARGPASSGGGG